ncbi:uncharacterized protein PAC_18554 [Phialocephala subalpina]|uniref:Nephrocystin 3-like N-terminal domain-containing protein n=1 Tax=Phialocephala subalpina TaxID=576137 RepID=A0A1L7XUG6_9HELO|nr:uncharacterized protein PAC_18554 [Phialocephala subalpina]
MLRQAQSIDVQAQSQGRWLLRSARFQDWLCSSRSDVLLADGNSEQYGMARCSPMTLMCAVLAQGLAKRDGTLVVHFFCGAHNTSGDDLAGPTGLIRSLIIQVLARYELDLSFMDSGRWYEHLEKQDPLVLCNLFHRIVAQLPGIILFCIIDGVSLFEKEQWRAQIELVVWKLREIVADPTMNVVLKLLITSPGISRVVKGILRAEDRIWIPKDAATEGKLLTGKDMAFGRSQTPGDSRSPR